MMNEFQPIYAQDTTYTRESETTLPRQIDKTIKVKTMGGVGIISRAPEGAELHL
jgi:hypothetical protein